MVRAVAFSGSSFSAKLNVSKASLNAQRFGGSTLSFMIWSINGKSSALPRTTAKRESRELLSTASAVATAPSYSLDFSRLSACSTKEARSDGMTLSLSLLRFRQC